MTLTLAAVATILKAVALVIVLLVFIGIAIRAFTTRRGVHESAARLPLDGDDAPVRFPRPESRAEPRPDSGSTPHTTEATDHG